MANGTLMADAYGKTKRLTLRGRGEAGVPGPKLMPGETLFQTPKMPGLEETTGGAVGNTGNLMTLAQMLGKDGATPGATTGEDAQPKTPLMDFWSKPVMGKMPLDQFVSLAGMLAGAIAPNTPQGRAGSALSNLATSVYGKRMGMEAGQEDAAAARGLVEAKTGYYDRLGRGKDKDTLSKWDLWSSENQHLSAADRIKGFEALDDVKGDKTYTGAVAQFEQIYGRPPHTGRELGKFNEAIKTATDKTGKPPDPSLLGRREMATAKDIKASENVILNPKEGANLQGEIDFFNEYSDKGYVYVHTPGEKKPWYTPDIDATTDKIQLPMRPDGKQMTSADVYHTAQKYHGGDINEVLRAFGIIEATSEEPQL